MGEGRLKTRHCQTDEPDERCPARYLDGPEPEASAFEVLLDPPHGRGGFLAGKYRRKMLHHFGVGV